MWKFLLVLIGGGIGSVLRFGISQAIGRSGVAGFPYGTLTVNLTGCLLIGIVAGMHSGTTLSDNTKLLLITGLLGGFTTFSSFSIETVQLFQQRQFMEGFLYVTASNILGIGCAAAGYWTTLKQ
ncbi:MAG: hypothetical protein RL021_2181 [Bacteroidota bacterium]|jgi:CrcB protein